MISLQWFAKRETIKKLKLPKQIKTGGSFEFKNSNSPIRIPKILLLITISSIVLL